jgi:hypothetical protein
MLRRNFFKGIATCIAALALPFRRAFSAPAGIVNPAIPPITAYSQTRFENSEDWDIRLSVFRNVDIRPLQDGGHEYLVHPDIYGTLDISHRAYGAKPFTFFGPDPAFIRVNGQWMEKVTDLQAALLDRIAARCKQTTYTGEPVRVI